MSFNYVVTAHKATAVTQSVACSFTSPDTRNLILAKGTRLDIFTVSPTGLVPLLELPLHGRISALRHLRPTGETTDLLFVSLERYDFCVLKFDAATQKIVTKSFGNLEDRIGEPAELGQLAIIDQECRLIGLRQYNGAFKVIPIDSRGQFKDAFNIRLEELVVHDIQFVTGQRNPTIAVLYQGTQDDMHIATYEVSVREGELKAGPWKYNNVEGGTSMLIPVDQPIGGIISVGEHHITYHSGSSFKSAAMDSTVMECFGQIDSTRFLMADSRGTLYSLLLVLENGEVSNLSLQRLGGTSIAACLCYVDAGVVFIGSRYGDAQLVRLLEQPNDHDSFIEEIDSFTNIGPMADVVVIDLDRQGQGQMITCSGAYQDGSLRVIHNGIGIQEHASLDLVGIKGTWALQMAGGDAGTDSILAISFVGQTVLIAMNGEELEEVAVEGLVTDEQTLLCANVSVDVVQQVTTARIRLVSATTGMVAEWVPDEDARISVVASNGRHTLVSLGGGRVVCLAVDTSTLSVVGVRVLPHEIACLHVADHLETPLAVAGLWTDMSVRVLELPSLDERCTQTLEGDIIPRSVMFAPFGDVLHLLVAVGDGSLYTYTCDAVTGGLSSGKRVNLGTQPITLRPFTSAGVQHVFASCDRPTVIHSTGSKLLFSNVNLRNVTNVCPLNSSAFPNSLAIAFEDTLLIGSIDEIQALHVRTVPLGEMPRRIAHCPHSHTLAVATVLVHNNVQVSDTEPGESAFVRLYDDQTFELLSTFPLNPFEAPGTLEAISFPSDPRSNYFAVGTAIVRPSEEEPSEGRVLILRVHQVAGGGASTVRLTLASEVTVNGAAYACAPLVLPPATSADANKSNSDNVLLACCINSRVVVFAWTPAEDATPEDPQHTLVQQCWHASFVLALKIQTKGEYILVGDLMSSCTLLRYNAQTNKLESVARDYNPMWCTAICALDEQHFLAADTFYNLSALVRNIDATNDSERQQLSITGEYHVGEYITQIRPGSLVMRLSDVSESVPSAELLFTTQSGAIGVVATLSDRYYNFLQKLSLNMTKVIESVCRVAHDQWRSFDNTRKRVPAHGFIDGDLIERFLDLPRADMASVCEGLFEMSGEGAREPLGKVPCTVEYITRIVEELARIH